MELVAGLRSLTVEGPVTRDGKNCLLCSASDGKPVVVYPDATVVEYLSGKKWRNPRAED